MDSGEEIPALNEGWNFLGAKLFEWLAGFFMAMILSEFVFKGSMSQSMPMLLATVVGTAVGLASVRSRFPDEERGMRNAFMTAIGFPPPGIPLPASLQPYWSPAPKRSLPNECEYMDLGLDKLFLRNTAEESLGSAEDPLNEMF